MTTGCELVMSRSGGSNPRPGLVFSLVGAGAFRDRPSIDGVTLSETAWVFLGPAICPTSSRRLDSCNGLPVGIQIIARYLKDRNRHEYRLPSAGDRLDDHCPIVSGRAK